MVKWVGKINIVIFATVIGDNFWSEVRESILFLYKTVTSSKLDVNRFDTTLVMLVTRKLTLRPLSLSYQKKDGCAWPCPSFIWYDTDFWRIKSFQNLTLLTSKILFSKSQCHTKRTMGAAMHHAKTLSSIFLWRVPCVICTRFTRVAVPVTCYLSLD